MNESRKMGKKKKKKSAKEKAKILRVMIALGTNHGARRARR